MCISNLENVVSSVLHFTEGRAALEEILGERRDAGAIGAAAAGRSAATPTSRPTPAATAWRLQPCDRSLGVETRVEPVPGGLFSRLVNLQAAVFA